jgi:hypothetical protein
LARPRPGGDLDAEPENVRARDRLRAAWGHASRFRNRGHHRFDHLVTQMWPWVTLATVAFAGACGHMAVFLSHHRHSTTDAVITLTAAAAAGAALLANHRRTRHSSRLMNLRDRVYILVCAATGSGWITWLTLAGVDGAARLALIWYVPAGVALSVPWWLAHPHRPAPPPPPPEVVEEEPDRYPLIARWAAEIAVPGILPGSALSEPVDIEAGIRYMLALNPGMAIEDAVQAQRKVASILGMGRHRFLFELAGQRPGRADNERIITLTVLNEVIRQDSTQAWTGPTLNLDTGYFDFGLYPDGPAQSRLYQVLGDPADQMYRAVHWMAAGLMGSGKSRSVDLAILEMLYSGRFVVWYGDGQNGTSSSALRDYVDWYADWHDEIVRMVFAAFAVMKARQYFLSTWEWTDKHGIKCHGAECLPGAAGLPFLELVLDEAHEPLRDPRISKVVREIQRLGPKLGIGVCIVTQITSVLDLGGASGDMGAPGLRAFAKAGGNVLLYRTGETLTATSMGVPGVNIDPRTLPIDPPGMCYQPFGARPEVAVRTLHVPPGDFRYWLSRANKAALDDLSAKAAGEDYATRRTRTKPPLDANEELAYLLGEKIRGGAQDTAKSAKSGGTGNLARVYQAVITLTAAGPVKRSDIETHLAAQPEGAVSESSLTTCLRQLTEHGKVSSPRHGHYDRPDADDLAEERAELAAEAMG